MADRPYPAHCTAGNCPCISCPHADRRAAPAPGGEVAGYVREWEGDDSDLGNWLFVAHADEKDASPNWRPVYFGAAIADAERAKP